MGSTSGTGPIHRAWVVKEFLATQARGRLHLEALPADTPEVNPVEGIGRYLKHVELRNLWPRTRQELRVELPYGIARLRHKSWLFQGCFTHAGY